MSASHNDPPNPSASGAVDPSMEDILASIRRILSDDEAESQAAPAALPPPAPAHIHSGSDVLALDANMIVDEPNREAAPMAPPPLPPPAPLATPDPTPSRPALVGPGTAAAAASSVGALLRTLSAEREQIAVYRGGPTIEDLVREEIRPLLAQWLDTNLPAMVERLVRAEIERVVGRAVS